MKRVLETFTTENGFTSASSYLKVDMMFTVFDIASGVSFNDVIPHILFHTKYG